MVRDAVHCHFPDEQNRPKVIRLQSAMRLLLRETPVRLEGF